MEIQQVTPDVETDEQKQQRARDTQTYMQLDALLKVPQFGWFIAEFIVPLLDEQDKVLKDLKSTDQQRTVAAHCFEQCRQIIKMLPEKHQYFFNASGLNEKELK